MSRGRDSTQAGGTPILDHRPNLSPDEMRRRSAEFLSLMQQRRSVRQFSDRPVERGVVETCIEAAGTSPSGANCQPWHFVVVESPEVKRRIREAAEVEERAFYEGRAPRAWLDALHPMGTSADKAFLETAPHLIVVFAQMYSRGADGERAAHYYPVESTCIAAGILVTALHHAGLATLTYTPASRGFLRELLGRPEGERPMLIIVAGHPADDAEYPDLPRKSPGEITTFL
jgi:iodotyrosine deiodinase